MPVDLSMIGLEGIKAHYEIDESKARAEYNQVLADAGRQKIDQENRDQEALRLASLAADSANMRDASSGDMLRFIGTEAIRNGAPELGAEYHKKASEIEENEAQAKQAEATARKNQLEVTIKTGTYIGNTLRPDMSDRQFNEAVSQLERAQNAGEIFLPEGTLEKIKEYGNDPEIIELYQNHAISAVEQARLDIKQQEQVRLQDNAMRAQGNADRLAHLAAQRVQIARDLADHQIATGGKNKPAKTIPNTFDIKQARAAVKSSVFSDVIEPKGKPNAVIDSAATYIAADTLQRLSANPALNYATAQQQAITQAKVDGVFGEVNTESHKRDGIYDVTVKKKTRTFNPAASLGKTPATALPPPPRGSDGKVDRAKLKANSYYTVNGQTYLYDGKGLIKQ